MFTGERVQVDKPLFKKVGVEKLEEV